MAVTIDKAPKGPKGPFRKKRGPLRRALRLFSFASLALMALLAALAIWLRTDSGLNFAARKAAGFLESQSGIAIAWEALQGPLPERLAASGLSARDASGSS